MKKILFLLMSAFVALSTNAQFDIKYRANDNYYLIKYGLDTTHVIPKGTTYAKLQYGNEIGLFYNNGQPIVNYVSHFLYNINGASVATPNALMDSLANILGMPLDSVGGGGIAGVESVNGKDGVLNIVAGSNITIDDSRQDTIVISSTGGGSQDLQSVLDNGNTATDIGLEIKTTDTFNDSVTTYLYGGQFYTVAKDSSTSVAIDPYSIQVASHLIDTAVHIIGREFLPISDNYAPFDKKWIQISSIIGSNGTGFALNDKFEGFKLSHKVPLTDNLVLTPKWYVDSVASASGGGGNYLPLSLTDSTSVALNGNSLIIQGQNHSLAINRSYEVLSALGAEMDGFQANQYDSIYTMNGLMKVPAVFGDTVRYPIMFMSENFPIVSPTFRASFMRPVFYPSDNGFAITHINSSDGEVLQLLTSRGMLFTKNDSVKIEFKVEGDITTAGEIASFSYVPKTSPYSYAQMQDIERVIITDPAPSTLIDPSNMEVVVIVNNDSSTILLPDTSDCKFWHLYIKNNSSTVVTVKTENDEVAFWEGGVLSDEYSALVGTVTHIIFDGENYLIK